MALYTDTKTFIETWPENSAERIFIREAAEIAYAYINSALAGVYDVPFTSVPDAIVKISNLLTRAIAMALISKGQVTVKDVKDVSGLDPIAWLEALRKGTMSLDGVSRLSTTGAWCSTAGQMHIFDLDHEFYHEVDDDRLDELENERL